MAMGRTNCCPCIIDVDPIGEIYLPAPPKSMSATPGNQTVTLNFTYHSTEYVSGMIITTKEGSYPQHALDGFRKDTVSGGTIPSLTIDKLTNGVTYYFRVFLYNETNGAKHYQTSTLNSLATGTPTA